MQDRTRVTLAFVVAVLMIGLTAWTWQRTRSQGPPVLHVGDPLTDMECAQFAEALQKAIDSKDGAAMESLIDWDALLEKANAGIDVPAPTKQGFAKAFREGLQRRGGFLNEITSQLDKGGSYRLLRVHQKEGEHRALFRLILEDNSVNYHDFALVRRPSGQVRAVDLHVFIAGEMLSQTVRRLFISLADQNSQGVLARLGGWENDYVKNMHKVGQMVAAAKGGRSQEALNIYKQLPSVLQADKNILLVRVMAAQDGSDLDYVSAVEDFRKHHPSDACIDMMSIDYYLLKKQFAMSLEMIDRVDKFLGGDPYLHVLRAGLHFEAGELDLSRKAADKAIEEEPTLERAYWIQVNVALRRKQFDEVVRLLTVVESRFGDNPRDFTGLPDYAEFLKSPQYEKWNNRKNK